MWLNPQFPVDLVIFTEKILNGKLHFLCSAANLRNTKKPWNMFKVNNKNTRTTSQNESHSEQVTSGKYYFWNPSNHSVLLLKQYIKY